MASLSSMTVTLMSTARWGMVRPQIFLPIVERSVEKVELAIQLPLLGGTETILVAEDEEGLRNLARDILEGLGYTVLLAVEWRRGGRSIQSKPRAIDLLLLDVVMPHMGGIEAYERIRELGTDVQLILMTGYSAATVQSGSSSKVNSWKSRLR